MKPSNRLCTISVKDMVNNHSRHSKHLTIQNEVEHPDVLLPLAPFLTSLEFGAYATDKGLDPLVQFLDRTVVLSHLVFDVSTPTQMGRILSSLKSPIRTLLIYLYGEDDVDEETVEELRRVMMTASEGSVLRNLECVSFSLWWWEGTVVESIEGIEGWGELIEVFERNGIKTIIV